MSDVVAELLGRDVSRETLAMLERFADFLIAENQVQNLISKSTEADLWARHFADAAQLIGYAPEDASWIDVGSGAGLPGLIIAIITGAPVTLVEPRRLRADFLKRASAELGLDNVTVLQAKGEAVPRARYGVITARAVASVDRLFAMTAHLSHGGTIWVLPKGRSAKWELDEARKSWQGAFRLEPSRTDPDARILIASGVRRVSRARGK
ncbi:16S rRNA (guanine(527)-N(7))-methyltransferase RsmG [Sphingomonas sp.]|uniref:16S rRNA (guanine(527)-N(7))-methyltransferase RsmG n=1 Tax=Sphingomonas sp. TaxID=28214 RepID=UPI00286B3BB8|nr:16S rRNA (guanine(527)-N(7))-methyltransferase RsmG [Sphingomonas sp.]